MVATVFTDCMSFLFCMLYCYNFIVIVEYIITLELLLLSLTMLLLWIVQAQIKDTPFVDHNIYDSVEISSYTFC